ncbi:tRNA methyltransferase, has a role in tRNA modification [Rhodotorula kratochvilovae]
MAALPQAASFESEHVHAVYDEIASDFSRTRHSRWPFVERFLHSLPPGGLVLDAGTGNGKYLGCRSALPWAGSSSEALPRARAKGKARAPEAQEDVPAEQRARTDLLSVGFDMSAGLLGIASARGHEVVRGDCVDMSCWRRGAFNHAISIATIHHFATPARRVESVKQLILAVLPPSPPSSPSPFSSSSSAPPAPPAPAKLLIVVWSLEQDPSLSSRGGDRSARRTTGGKKGAVPIPGERDGEAQDVFVPWERQEQMPRAEKVKAPRQRRKKGDKHNAAGAAAAEEAALPVDAPPAPADPSAAPAPDPAPKPTFNRYYHLFRAFELSSLVASAAAQLSLTFSAPEGYPIELLPAEGKKARCAVEEREGWEAFVRLEEERWERENWVVEVAVGWRRVDDGGNEA